MPFLSNLPRLRLSPWLLGLGSFFAALACATYLLFGLGYSYETTEVSATPDGVVGTETVTRGWENALSAARQNHDYTIAGWPVHR